MIPTIKINNRIKIEQYLSKGIKIYVKLDNDKWICIKFNNVETKLLNFVLRTL